MANVPVTSSFVYDPLELAFQIEDAFKAYFIDPDVGIYVVGKEEPVIVPGKRYFRQEKGGLLIEISITSLDDIRGEIFDADDRLVVTEKLKKLMRTESELPLIGLRIIHEFVESVLTDNSAWTRSRPKHLSDIWSKFIRPEYRNSEVRFNSDTDFQCSQVYDKIYGMLANFQTELIAFIGEDKWIMHFKKRVGTDIVVEKTIDYRIYDWQRRMDAGEWV